MHLSSVMYSSVWYIIFYFLLVIPFEHLGEILTSSLSAQFRLRSITPGDGQPHFYNLFIITLERHFLWRKADDLVTFPLRTVTFPWSSEFYLYFYGIVGILIDGVDDLHSQRSGRQCPSIITKFEI